MFRQWYCLEATFVLAWQILAFPFPGYFIRIPFPRHDHVFTQCYTDYFTANIVEMLTHACAIGTRPLFPSPSWPGYEAKTNVAQKKLMEKAFVETLERVPWLKCGTYLC